MTFEVLDRSKTIIDTGSTDTHLGERTILLDDIPTDEVCDQTYPLVPLGHGLVVHSSLLVNASYKPTSDQSGAFYLTILEGADLEATEIRILQQKPNGQLLEMFRTATLPVVTGAERTQPKWNEAFSFKMYAHPPLLDLHPVTQRCTAPPSSSRRGISRRRLVKC